MPRSLDFQWQDGEPAPAPVRETEAPAPAPYPYQHRPADGVSLGPDASPPRRRGWQNLLLLILGIALGAAAGFVLLTVQGQRSAASDLAPLFALRHQALVDDDNDLFDSLLPAPQPSSVAQTSQYREERSSYLALMDAEAGPPQVRRVQLTGNLAEIEISFPFRGQSYRRIETARRFDGAPQRWRLARPPGWDWGGLETTETASVRLTTTQRDAFVTAMLPEIQAVVRAFCARYAVPAPCQIDLTIAPDSELLPFIPGMGASPPPSRHRYSGSAQSRTQFITLNGSHPQMFSPELQDELLGALRAPLTPGTPRTLGSVDNLFVFEESPPEAQVATAKRIYEPTIPIKMISPRLVGLTGSQPHPLWRLALYESIGDAILRRALGPITGGEEAVYPVWAVAQGDVTVWAERFSGVLTPSSASPADDAPANIGRALAVGDATARPAARALALRLHARYGEAAVLAFFPKAHQGLVAETSLDPPQITLWRETASAPGTP